MIAASPHFFGIPVADPHRSSLPTRPLSARSPSLRAPRFTASHTSAAERFSSAPAASLYDELGLSLGATGAEIKAAYRRLARACHPDVVASDRKGASADEFMRINAAYSTLSDPDKRAEYDRTLFMLGRQRRPAPSASPFSSGYNRRTWETDQCW